MASIPIVDGLDVASVRLFLDVVELGSVSKAAVRHRLAQPSATARLQKLERQLGVQLLDRAPTGSDARPRPGVRLAPACADVVAAAVALVDRAETVVVERPAARRRRHPPRRRPLPARPGSRRPSSTTCASSSSRATRSPSPRPCASGEADRRRSPTARRHRSGCARSVVASEEIVPVVGRRHPWFGRAPRRSAARTLVGATLALPPPGSGTLDVVAAALAPFEFGDRRRPHRGRQLGRGAHRRAQRAGGRVPAPVSRRRRAGVAERLLSSPIRDVSDRATGARRVARAAPARRAGPPPTGGDVLRRPVRPGDGHGAGRGLATVRRTGSRRRSGP